MNLVKLVALVFFWQNNFLIASNPVAKLDKAQAEYTSFCIYPLDSRPANNHTSYISLASKAEDQAVCIRVHPTDIPALQDSYLARHKRIRHLEIKNCHCCLSVCLCGCLVVGLGITSLILGLKLKEKVD